MLSMASMPPAVEYKDVGRGQLEQQAGLLRCKRSMWARQHPSRSTSRESRSLLRQALRSLLRCRRAKVRNRNACTMKLTPKKIRRGMLRATG